MEFKLDPEKGLLVSNPTVGWPLSEQAGQELVAIGLKQSGKMPRIVEKDGEQYAVVTYKDDQWHEVDRLLGIGLIVDGEMV